MNGTEEKIESLSVKESNEETALIAALKSSANHQEVQNKATNDRIDKLDGHMIKLVDKITTLVEAGIRREASDISAAERGDRLEKSQIELSEKFNVVERQVFLLKKDYDTAKEDKDKKENNKDTRKNTVIAALTIAFIIAILKIIGPYL